MSSPAVEAVDVRRSYQLDGVSVEALRGVSLVDVWRHISGAKPAPLLAAVVLATLTFPLRLIRWRLLLRDERGCRRPYVPRPPRRMQAMSL